MRAVGSGMNLNLTFIPLKSDALYQLLEFRQRAKRVETRFDFKICHPARVFVRRFIEPIERGSRFAQTEPDNRNIVSRNKFLRALFFEFTENFSRFRRFARKPERVAERGFDESDIGRNGGSAAEFARRV